jgi:hypothetical protein
MQINNASTFSSGNVQTLNNKTSANNQQTKKVAAPDESEVTAIAPPERLEVSEQAITLLEQQSATKNNQQDKSSNNTAKLNQFADQNATAVNAYQSVNNLAQRENIQAMLGVDLFA